LTQAEAVLDIIHAKTDAFLRVSTHQLKGELSTQQEDIRVQLMRIYTTLEAFVNFPEDEIDEQNRTNICDDVSEQRQRVADLLTSSHNGRLLREGIRVVLCGKPNVGKSSLLNVLLKTQRAIVTDIAGTTRDVIEEAARIGDLPFQLVDTAGILEPRDLVEEEAIKRSHLYIDSADLVLMVFDLSRPLEKQDEMLIEKVRNQKTVVVFNKADLPDAFDVAAVDAALPGCKKVMLSTLTREGQGDLEKAILETVLDGGSLDPHGLMISNVRHIQSLKETERALESARRLMTDAVSLEFVSEEIKQAVNALDGITGRNIDADLLDRIFSDFCIGK
jgi:tRNA modification GTPase